MIRTKLGQNHTDFLYLVSGIWYPAESGHQLSGGIRYPVKIAIRYIPSGFTYRNIQPVLCVGESITTLLAMGSHSLAILSHQSQ